MHSVHWRLRGSCRNERPSTCSRVDPDRQLVGDDHRLVAPAGVAGVVDRRHHAGRRPPCRARPTTAERVPQVPPGRRACAARRRRRRTRLPSNMFVDSITRSSVDDVERRAPRPAAARSPGRAPAARRPAWVMSRSPIARRPARPSAGRGRRGGSRRGGRRGRRSGLCTSPWRSRWTIGASLGLAPVVPDRPAAAAAARAAAGSASSTVCSGAVVVGGGDEPRLEGADGGR